MTTIAAFMDDKGRVAIAADRQFTGNTASFARKLYEKGRLAFAGTGIRRRRTFRRMIALVRFRNPTERFFEYCESYLYLDGPLDGEAYVTTMIWGWISNFVSHSLSRPPGPRRLIWA